MRSNVCTKSSSDGSKRRPCCRRLTLRQCCSGRCSPLDRSTCGKLTVGRRLQQSPSISQLTSLPDQVLSKCRRSRHPKFQHKSRRHPSLYQSVKNAMFFGHLSRPRPPAQMFETLKRSERPNSFWISSRRDCLVQKGRLKIG